jgi:hypothetical protein
MMPPLKVSTPCQALVLKRVPTFRLSPTFGIKTEAEWASKMFFLGEWGYSSIHSELRTRWR